MSLTDRQKRFVTAYFQCGFNATEAAKRAGYSENRASVEGCELKKEPAVAAAIEERLKAEAMSANEVLQHLGAIGRGDWQHYVETNESGTILRIDFARMKADGKLNLMKDWEPMDFGYKVKWNDRMDALGLLAKHHKLLTDRMELDVSGLSDDDLIAATTSALGGVPEAGDQGSVSDEPV